MDCSLWLNDMSVFQRSIQLEPKERVYIHSVVFLLVNSRLQMTYETSLDLISLAIQDCTNQKTTNVS